MKKARGRFFGRMADMTPVAMGASPDIALSCRRKEAELTIARIAAIREYSTCCMVFLLSDGKTVTIEGDALLCCSYTAGQMRLRGVVQKISLSGEVGA